MSSRRDLIMSRVRQPVEDSQYPETIPNLLCTEVLPISPNSSNSFVENSDFSEDDLRNDSFLKLCRKKTVEVKPIHETSIIIEKASSPFSSTTKITPVMTTEKCISPRKSCNKPSASYATDYFSDNEDVYCPKDFDSDDSVKDKNYSVTEELDSTDLDTSIEENDFIKKRKPNKNKIKLYNQIKYDKRAEVEGKIQDSEDQTDQKTKTQENRVETETVTIASQQDITEKEIFKKSDNTITNNKVRQATSIIQSEDLVIEAAKTTLTKKGTIRKRKIIKESPAEREEKKKKGMIEKLSLKEPCKPTCKKLCTKNICMEQRQVINSTYSALDAAGKGMFIKNNISVANVKSRKNINKEPKRNQTFNYFFTVRGHENPVQVCKTFFLATLGYNPKNDTKVFRVLHTSEEDELKDKRGHYDRSSLSKDKTLITSHIMTFNPAISHYRREHAPYRLYLPSDISVTMMHADFNKIYSDSACSYEVYRRVVKSHNISFAVLGNEDCELCAVYNVHACEFNKAPNTTCATCNNHVEHRQRYTDSRKAYKLDKKNVEEHKDNDTVYVCVDLQKVVMLPRMDSCKVAIFCPRIIAFNETFAPQPFEPLTQD